MPTLPNPVTLRDARRDDVPLIVRMLADDRLGGARETVSEPLPQGYYDAFDWIAADPNNRLLVAELDGKIVGTLQLTFIRGLSKVGAGIMVIEAVRVAGELRGRGVGRQMIAGAIEIARERGCRSVELSTSQSRVDAQRFYEQLGFAKSHFGMKLALG
jgi:ribosomal protein S18 acetylase RimI-like enzyme